MFGRFGYFVGEQLFGCYPIRPRAHDLWVRLLAARSGARPRDLGGATRTAGSRAGAGSSATSIGARGECRARSLAPAGVRVRAPRAPADETP